VAILAVATALRLANWGDVFTSDGVRLAADDDSLYHVLRTERMIEGAVGAPWRDGAMNSPDGAEIPWPPLFDGALAGAGWAAAGFHTPSRGDIERGGSFLPVLLALLALPAVAALARMLAGDDGLLAALVLALLPAHGLYSMLGRTDQHVLEVLLFVWILVPVAHGVRRPDRSLLLASAALGALYALAFWNWIGSGFYPLLLTAFTGAWAVVAPGSDRVSRRLAADLALGAGLGAVLLAGSVALARGPAQLTLMRLAGLSGLQPLMLAIAAAFGALLSAALQWRAATATLPRRAAVVAGCALTPLLVALTVPGVGAEVGRGLSALGRSNGWYGSIMEFEPLIGGGWTAIGEDVIRALAIFGLAPFAAVVAVALLAPRLREPDRRAPTALLIGLGLGLLLMAFLRQRFAPYSAPLLAVLVAHSWGRGATAISRRFGWRRLTQGVAFLGIGAIVFGPALGLARNMIGGEPPVVRETRRVLTRLAALPVAPGRTAIMAEWSLGHLIQYVTGRPVVASPFGIEGGDRALEDSAAFFLEADESAAAALLERRRAGLVALRDPTYEIVFAAAFTPPMRPLSTTRRTLAGAKTTFSPEVRGLVVWRLFVEDGAAGARGLGGFRLLDEARYAADRTIPFKIFGAVPGATLVVGGAVPQSTVIASTVVVSPLGRRFEWATSAGADASGRVALRVPYATGQNGRCAAAPYEVRAGSAATSVQVDEKDVTLGRSLRVSIDARPMPRAQ
jgi:dolichyl-diphosphooligosaccharide--protein glycosyltransferase